VTGTIRVALGLALAAGAGAGCQPSDEAQPGDSSVRGETAAAMTGMTGMAGHAGMMSGAMMDSMHSHMSMMDTMSATSVKAMFPTHRRMVDSMLTRMSSDMRGMNVTADAGWTATADSIRADLDRMATMGGSQLKSAMGTHHQRLMRLMQMHRGMMGPTKTQ
jgi:hypothetical protein